MRILSAAATDVGLVRKNNEDSFLVDDEIRCYAVADGMGGHQGGEIASSTAIESLRGAVTDGRRIDEAIVIANDNVLGRAGSDPELTGMGTTLTAAVVDGSDLIIGHVGDSRAYLVRNGELRQLTDDHSLVGALVREGRLTPEEAENHPQRSVVTRCLGSYPGVEVDVVRLPLAGHDRIILCSDGLSGMVRDETIAAIAAGGDTSAQLAQALVDAACAAGGQDNVTVVVLDFEDIEEHSSTDTVVPAAPRSPRTESGVSRIPAVSAAIRYRTPALIAGLGLVVGIVIGLAVAGDGSTKSAAPPTTTTTPTTAKTTTAPDWTVDIPKKLRIVPIDRTGNIVKAGDDTLAGIAIASYSSPTDGSTPYFRWKVEGVDWTEIPEDDQEKIQGGNATGTIDELWSKIEAWRDPPSATPTTESGPTASGE